MSEKTPINELYFKVEKSLEPNSDRVAQLLQEYEASNSVKDLNSPLGDAAFNWYLDFQIEFQDNMELTSIGRSLFGMFLLYLREENEEEKAQIKEVLYELLSFIRDNNQLASIFFSHPEMIVLLGALTY
jgi:phage terminase large subunit